MFRYRSLLYSANAIAASLILYLTTDLVREGLFEDYIYSVIATITLLQVPLWTHNSSAPVRQVIGLCFGVIVFYLIALLFGAPLFSDIQRTAAWSALMSSLVSLPMSYALDAGSADTTNKQSAWAQVGIVALGSWVGAFPMPLDWDRPWQAWPISCTYGALVAYAVASVVGVVFSLSRKNT